jgi:predicted DNA-binding transcriptional regulator AlpA
MDARNCSCNGEGLMSPQDVSDYLQVPVTTLHNWHYSSTGPPCAKIGRHLRYRRVDVEAWVAERYQLDATQRDGR